MKSALCTLLSTSDEAGAFDCRGIMDQMSDEQFDVALSGVAQKDKLAFTADQQERLRGEGASLTASGVEVRMALAEEQCFVDSSTGVLKLRRVWAEKGADDADAKELFEGFFEFTVNHSAVYARKGFDRKAQYSAGFWAVRN
jgi:hypothetical protein